MSTTTRSPLAMHASEVKKCRAALGLAQADLAPKLHVSVRQYKRYEAVGIPRVAGLRADRLRQLAKVARR